MTCQPEQDGDICLRSRHQLRPRGIWSNRSGKYSRWSAVPSWNRFSGPAVDTNKVTLPLIGRATQVEVWLCSNNIVSKTQWFYTLAMLVWWTRISCVCLFSLTAAGLNICATDKSICALISQTRRIQKNFVLWTSNEIFASMLLSNYHGWFSIKNNFLKFLKKATDHKSLFCFRYKYKETKYKSKCDRTKATVSLKCNNSRSWPQCLPSPRTAPTWSSGSGRTDQLGGDLTVRRSPSCWSEPTTRSWTESTWRTPTPCWQTTT